VSCEVVCILMIQCFFKFITQTELIKSFDERVARTKYILEYKKKLRCHRSIDTIVKNSVKHNYCRTRYISISLTIDK